jgi:hypothetical protein
MEWIPTLEYLLSCAHGACGHVLSCQTVNAATSWDPVSSKNISDTKSSQVERLDALARPRSEREAGRTDRW